LEYPGKGHFPQCLVSTAYDVFRRLPVARTIVGIPAANERDEAQIMLPIFRPGICCCLIAAIPVMRLFGI
jgi:hypothetical protein